LAYLAAGHSGLRVIDVSDPTNPYEVGRCPVPGYAEGVYVSGSLAYVATWGPNSLRVVDVSNPFNPHVVGYCTTPTMAVNVYVHDSIAYVAATESGLRIIDVSNSASPHELGYYNTPGSAEGVYVLDFLAYIADHQRGLCIVDVTDPATPHRLGHFDNSKWALEVFISGSLAYIADMYGLYVVDVSAPSNPHQVGYYNTTGLAEEVWVSGSLSFVADYDAGLVILEYLNETFVEESSEPLNFSLYQNYPNPFNPTTTIEYNLPKNGHAVIEIVDILGRQIRTLIAKERTAGSHQVTWNGLDDAGNRVASGVYLYRMTAEGFTETRKLLLLK
jgi:hypothetical protein